MKSVMSRTTSMRGLSSVEDQNRRRSIRSITTLSATTFPASSINPEIDSDGDDWGYFVHADFETRSAADRKPNDVFQKLKAGGLLTKNKEASMMLGWPSVPL
eukprot:CAMPEP_0178789536 /NCGR_PEP_ID=MMETSP0745-20121128/6951_1 /TAXON_ID=913974 /ORGANISM="Nitzschia punctata, Strain CCMP561" /LENGTH=101 /DNA_ID=CAMNT_0020447481 /DNA_START=99 /DNA_END=404 /DNA_ORIENTATION=+